MTAARWRSLFREKREVRGEVAIAMRPDGSRRAFTPYPTPLFAKDGESKARSTC